MMQSLICNLRRLHKIPHLCMFFLKSGEIQSFLGLGVPGLSLLHSTEQDSEGWVQGAVVHFY